jgi:hypothetical protein
VSRVRAWLDRHAGPACRLERTTAGYRPRVPERSVYLARFQAYAGAGAASEDPASQFDRLSAALDEWRGPVLGGRPEWLSVDPVVRTIEHRPALRGIDLQLRAAARLRPVQPAQQLGQCGLAGAILADQCHHLPSTARTTS